MADELMTCANCGHTQATGAFCEACGTKLAPAAAAPATPAPEPTPPPAPTPPVFPAQPVYPAQPAPGTPPYPGVYPGYPPAPSPFMDYLVFKKFLIPRMAQIAFWVFEAVNLFYWIRMIYYGHHSALEVIFSLVGLIATALLIRVFMETVITIFKNSKE